MGFLDDYEPVEDRLRAFWEEHPEGRIVTELVSHADGDYIFRAEVFKLPPVVGATTNGGVQLPDATGYAHDSVAQLPNNMKASALEVCETSAIGRALANMGYAPKGRRPSREEMQKSERPESVRVGEGAPDSGTFSPEPHMHEWVKTLPDGKQARPGWVVCAGCGAGEKESKVTVLTAPVGDDEERRDLK